MQFTTPQQILDQHARTAADGLREPVRFVEPFGAWFVHRHAEVDRVLTEYETFSSDELRYSAQEVPHGDNPVLRSMLATDPPRHHVLRRIVSRAFTPRAIDALTPRITATVHELLDRAEHGGRDGRLSVIDELAYPLPIATISALLGVAAGRQEDFVRWTEAITSFAGSFTEDQTRRIAFRKALTELGDYFRDVFAEHRRFPREDVVGTLLEADPDGTRLTDDELVNFCTLLLINGHETTKTLLVNLLLCLDTRPEVQAGLRRSPELVPGAIEEAMRLLPPSGGTDRFTTRPTTIGGHDIDAGARVIAMIVSANRDPEVFTDPDRFEPRRDPNPHLSFGHGIHFCLGAHLARREVGIALRTMLDRLPGRWSLPQDAMVTEVNPVAVDVLRLDLAWQD